MPYSPKEISPDIREDKTISRLLEKMPNAVANSFTEEQLSHIKNAIGAREWGSHKIDVRGTIKFFKWRYYYVFLSGRNRRTLSDSELKLSRLINTLGVALFVFTSMIFGFLTLYLIKSAMGINIFEGFSLGIWGWFKQTFLS